MKKFLGISIMFVSFAAIADAGPFCLFRSRQSFSRGGCASGQCEQPATTTTKADPVPTPVPPVVVPSNFADGLAANLDKLKFHPRHKRAIVDMLALPATDPSRVQALNVMEAHVRVKMGLGTGPIDWTQGAQVPAGVVGATVGAIDWTAIAQFIMTILPAILQILALFGI